VAGGAVACGGLRLEESGGGGGFSCRATGALGPREEGGGATGEGGMGAAAHSLRAGAGERGTGLGFGLGDEGGRRPVRSAGRQPWAVRSDGLQSRSVM